MSTTEIKNASIHLNSNMQGDLVVSASGTIVIAGKLVGRLENYGKTTVIGDLSGIVINHVGAQLIVEQNGMINGESLDNFGDILLQGEILSPCNNHSSGVIQSSGGSLGSILLNLGSIS